MKYKILSFIFTLSLFGISSVSAQRNLYYVADAVECSSIKYICEGSWERFSDSKGCGCKKAIEESSCDQDSKPVCGTPSYSCPSGVTCSKPLPKTYTNKCLLKEAGANYLSKGECKKESELPEATQKKYYVGTPDTCTLIKYKCDSGWDYFSDTLGCGCEKTKTDNTVKLDRDLEKKLEQLVANFIKKLESKYSSSDKKSDVLQDIIVRFEKLGKTEKYREIANYIINLLKDYSETLKDELDSVTDIFDIF